MPVWGLVVHFLFFEIVLKIHLSIQLNIFAFDLLLRSTFSAFSRRPFLKLYKTEIFVLSFWKSLFGLLPNDSYSSNKFRACVNATGSWLGVTDGFGCFIL